MTLLVHAGYQLSTRTGVVLGPDGRPVGRLLPCQLGPRHRMRWAWHTNNGAEGTTDTRAAALAALTAHLEQEADGAS